MHPTISAVTARIIERSKATRAQYLKDMQAAHEDGVTRQSLHCGNLAHAFAACGPTDKAALSENYKPNLGIIINVP